MLRVKNLYKEYDRKVLDGFSMEFPLTGVVCLFGPSGCGKTSLLHIVAGLDTNFKGEIEGTEGKKISYLFQENRLLPWLTARENVLSVNGDEKLADRLLDSFGLSEDKNKYPSQLSGGMCRRVALARCLCYGGDIYLMDEPFKGVDVAAKESIIVQIKSMLQNKLCIFVTHDIEEAASLSDEIVIVTGLPFTVMNKIQCFEKKQEKLLSKKPKNDIIAEIRGFIDRGSR